MKYTEEQIEEYCMNKLSGVEKVDFEKELEEDINLQHEVKSTTLALKAVNLLIKKDIEGLFFETQKKTLKNIPSEPAKIVVMKTPTLRNYFAYAAAVTLLVSIVGWAVITSSHERALGIAVNHVEIINPSVRGTNESTTSLDRGLNEYFNKKDYRSAINHFQTSENSDATFYLSMSYLQNGNFDKAEDLLMQLIASPNFPRHITTEEDIQWYIILSKIGAKKYASSRDAVKEIDEYLLSPSAKYQVDAIKLKKRLENPLYNLRTKY